MSEVLLQSRVDLMAAVDQEMADIDVFYKAKIDQLEAQIGAQTERANAAEKALKDHMGTHEPEQPPPPPPPKLKQVFGSSYGGGDESLNEDPGASRLFWNGDVMINDIATDKYFKQAVADGVKVHVMSWKSHDDGELEDLLKSLAKWQAQGHIFLGAHHHEIENDCKPGDATHKKFLETTKRHMALMRKYNVIPGQVFMQFTLTKGSGRNLRDWFVKGAVFVLYDAYLNPRKGKDDPVAMHDRIMAATKELEGVEFSGLGEHGVPNAENAEPVVYDLINKSQAKLRKHADYMLVNCYWPSRGFEFPSQRVAHVWFKGNA